MWYGSWSEDIVYSTGIPNEEIYSWIMMLYSTATDVVDLNKNDSEEDRLIQNKIDRRRLLCPLLSFLYRFKLVDLGLNDIEIGDMCAHFLRHFVNISICNLYKKYTPQTSARCISQACALHHMHILLNVYYNINSKLCHLMIWIRTLQLFRIKCIAHNIQVSIHMWIFVCKICINIYYCEPSQSNKLLKRYWLHAWNTSSNIKYTFKLSDESYFSEYLSKLTTSNLHILIGSILVKSETNCRVYELKQWLVDRAWVIIWQCMCLQKGHGNIWYILLSIWDSHIVLIWYTLYLVYNLCNAVP